MAAPVLVGRRGADDLVVRGARVLDPTEGVDAILDVRVDGGTIAAIGENVDTNAHRVVDGAGLVVRMAVLYDLLTTGPVVVETAVVGVA